MPILAPAAWAGGEGAKETSAGVATRPRRAGSEAARLDLNPLNDQVRDLDAGNAQAGRHGDQGEPEGAPAADAG
jgi:hypothetical protein